VSLDDVCNVADDEQTTSTVEESDGGYAAGYAAVDFTQPAIVTSYQNSHKVA
jgi:hypothetical protein